MVCGQARNALFGRDPALDRRSAAGYPEEKGPVFRKTGKEWNAWNKCADDGTLNCIKNLRGNFLCSDAVMDDDYNLIDTNENRYLSI